MHGVIARHCLARTSILCDVARFLCFVLACASSFTCAALYDDFVLRYKERFPSKHELGCKRYAGLNIDHKPGVSLAIHQRHHIENAYNKFVTDKDAAAKSSYGESRDYMHALAVVHKEQRGW